MTTHKNKKVTKYRGSKTHGGGAMKKRRGAGNRGGRGNAGSGKRADSKKPSIWADKYYFGKHGFKKKGIKEKICAVNVGYINEKIDSLKNKGLAAEKGGVYDIDLSRIGFNKLLGSGEISKKVVIRTKYAVENAIEKVSKAGGNVMLPEKKEAPKPDKAKQEGNKEERELKEE
ncbi:MAG TPA: uL15 family ribosomal protein [Candidatus Nanoarchaeia archaeon]|nr:ribosomal protein L15 [uncultured archaeon]HLC99270.1 uL15 family ribosomal protein [Candidatus Nanoarchaeia archaeon]